MICKIAVENFYSVADRQEIDFRVGENAPDLPCFRVSSANPKQRLPLVAGFFGANASGKSTILRAVNSLKLFIQQSFQIQPQGSIPFFNPYMHKDWWSLPTKILFESEGEVADESPWATFRYELHLANEPTMFAKAVDYESLSYAPGGRWRRLFSRTRQEFTFGPDFEMADADLCARSIRPNAGVISTLAQFNHRISTDLSQALNGLVTNIAGLDKSQDQLGLALNFYAQHPGYLERLNRELSRLDLGLEEMKIIAASPGPLATFRHTGLGSEIFVAQESRGTRRFIEIFPLLQVVLDRGGIAIIDELDNDVHPMLLPEIFRWFYDKTRNPHGAQLLFAGHNPAILNDLEKEQVFFTEKPAGRPTRVYGARDIKGLRREPSLMKKYLSGELGAVPHIG